eukprot:12374_1
MLKMQMLQQKIFMKLDIALDAYYRAHGVNNYFSEGNGKLSKYIMEKKLDQEFVSLLRASEEELQLTNSAVTYFDLEFPFPTCINGDELSELRRHQIMLDIVRYCYQNNAPPSDEFIKTNLYKPEVPSQESEKYFDQVQSNNQQLTVIDGLFNCLKHKHKMPSHRMKKMKDFLQNEEYDSDGLALEVLRNNYSESNLTKHRYEYAIVKLYMKQNTENCESYPVSIIKLSYKLTKHTIPMRVVENFVDTYQYMKKFIFIYRNQAVVEFNNGDILVIDFNLHCKNTKERLYAIGIKQNDNKNKYCVNLWNISNELYTLTQIKTLYNISEMKLYRPLQMRKMLMHQLTKQMKEIETLLQNENVRNTLITSKRIKWNHCEKVPIFNKKQKLSFKRSLQLSKKEFVDKLNKFSKGSENNIRLVPIAIQDGVKYNFGIVWIVKLAKNINIGISLQMGKNVKSIMPCGIFLDLQQYHELVPCLKCQCLENIVCNIDSLIIESEESRVWSKNKMLQAKIYEMENVVKATKMQRQKSAKLIIKTTNSTLQIKSSENCKKYEQQIKRKSEEICDLENKLDNARQHIHSLEKEKIILVAQMQQMDSFFTTRRATKIARDIIAKTSCFRETTKPNIPNFIITELIMN